MHQRLLLVHPARSVRMLLVRQLLAEVSNVQVDECKTATEAVALLGQRRFRLLLAAPGPAGVDAIRLQQACAAAAGPTGLLLVQTAEEARDLAGLEEAAGLTHALRIPCSAGELTRAVEAAVDPRRGRAHPRLHIPGATATFTLDGQPATGVVVNLSQSGLLAEVAVAADDHRCWTRLVDETALTLALPDQLPLALPGALRRLQLAVSPAGGLVARLAFRFSPASAGTLARLELLLADEERRLAQAWRPAAQGEGSASEPQLWRAL